MFAMQKNNKELKISPCIGKYSKEEKIIQTHVQNTKKNFLYPPLSATTPIIGENKAIKIDEIATALPHITAPCSGFNAIKSTKNVEYINVSIIVVNG